VSNVGRLLKNRERGLRKIWKKNTRSRKI